MARKILLTVYSILFLSPLISFVIGSAVAEDTLDTGIETTVDTSDIAENSEWTGSEVVYTLTIDGAIGAVTAERIEDLQTPPSNKLEKKEGDLQAFYAIWVNTQWRIIFKWIDNTAHEVQLIDYH